METNTANRVTAAVHRGGHAGTAAGTADEMPGKILPGNRLVSTRNLIGTAPSAENRIMTRAGSMRQVVYPPNKLL